MLKLFKLPYITKKVGIVIRSEVKSKDVYISTFLIYMYLIIEYVKNFMKNKSSIGVLR